MNIKYLALKLLILCKMIIMLEMTSSREIAMNGAVDDRGFNYFSHNFCV